MHPKEVFKRVGYRRAFPLIGFCAFWRKMGAPPLETLSAEIREEMHRQGVSKSAAYRYIAELRQWNEELGRAPEELDDLARQVAAVFDVEETTEEAFPLKGNPATIQPSEGLKHERAPHPPRVRARSQSA